MTNEQAGVFIKTIYKYQLTGESPALDFAMEMAIAPFINQYKRDDKNYQTTCERRRIAGSKGGKQKVANASNSKQHLANLADSDSKSDSDSKKDSKNKKEKQLEQFESFWNIYNKKTGRAEVEKKFIAALKKDSFENILSGLQAFVKSRGEDSKYWKNPSTWLNQECWKDELQTVSQSNTNDSLVEYLNNLIGHTLIARIIVSASNKAEIWFKDSQGLKDYQKLPEDTKQEIRNKIVSELKTTGFEPKY